MFNAHHCPTIKDFKPHIDSLLTSLEERKNAVIEMRNQTIAELKKTAESRDKTIQQWEQAYRGIEYIINGLSAPSLLPFEKQIHEHIEALGNRLDGTLGVLTSSVGKLRQNLLKKGCAKAV